MDCLKLWGLQQLLVRAWGLLLIYGVSLVVWWVALKNIQHWYDGHINIFNPWSVSLTSVWSSIHVIKTSKSQRSIKHQTIWTASKKSLFVNLDCCYCYYYCCCWYCWWWRSSRRRNQTLFQDLDILLLDIEEVQQNNAFQLQSSIHQPSSQKIKAIVRLWKLADNNSIWISLILFCPS